MSAAKSIVICRLDLRFIWVLVVVGLLGDAASFSVTIKHDNDRNENNHPDPNCDTKVADPVSNVSFFCFV